MPLSRWINGCGNSDCHDQKGTAMPRIDLPVINRAVLRVVGA